jgi:hypothetical protein
VADPRSRELLREALRLISTFCEAVLDEHAVALAAHEITRRESQGAAADREAALASLGALLVVRWSQDTGRHPLHLLEVVRGRPMLASGRSQVWRFMWPCAWLSTWMYPFLIREHYAVSFWSRPKP